MDWLANATAKPVKMRPMNSIAMCTASACSSPPSRYVRPAISMLARLPHRCEHSDVSGLANAPAFRTPADIPFSILLPAFVTSELKTAFQIGFAIYLPFIIIDAVVASVLMSMGMFMLPPAMISLPFKLLLFVLVDGWSLTITSLVQSFK